MSWADPVIATALAALAERTATSARLCVTMPSSWNPHDVWLARVMPPSTLAAQPSSSGRSTTPPRQGTALRDSNRLA